MESPVLNAEEKKKFDDIRYGRAGKIEVMRSLQILSEFLSKYYNKSVILLIDEYDVPMARATSNGYYKEMLKADTLTAKYLNGDLKIETPSKRRKTKERRI